ncbi:MAG: acylphosphatase, partial [Sulfitobacter litoralis]|nr:acylphosphatase [Sulfitobacter litoralis]
MTCSRFYVSGRVQGVFFRVSTRDQARALGLAGEVSNLADGRVAVMACGSQAALDSL